ncbi:hypothetical protein SMACR_06735 [Sordaria macrospora]|uniref:WGS project CABT00000000 data, contig 2.3 n=2 Tax=Sordaria macrospora TaxID=5147 RepID=F7VPV5_SORMK|nr:uncharacterized protein SMAC_06735 [Sordaria macrospora k-hell]KAA8631554.1 hypothetical protein SMACR_06735 [Sordaria macrospora]WPJ64927.1 hypothetical protein SMAC4_06735 [Sordaria macrospora]CCC07533.1 unnamed protein product [Sordaria macrospora k-hell]
MAQQQLHTASRHPSLQLSSHNLPPAGLASADMQPSPPLHHQEPPVPDQPQPMFGYLPQNTTQPPVPLSTLLTDDQSRWLDSFFQNLDDPSADDNPFAISPNFEQEGLSFTSEWNMRPGNLVGSNTSFAPYARTNYNTGFNDLSSVHNFGGPSFNHQLQAPPRSTDGIHDLLNAAAALPREVGGHGGISFEQICGGGRAPAGQHGIQNQADNSFGGAAIALAMRPYPPVHEPPNNFYRDMIFQQPGQSQQPRQNSYQHEQPVRIQFGTDTSFSQSTFTPQRTQESSEVMSQAQLKVLDCLVPSQSAATTRASSPVNQGVNEHHNPSSPPKLRTHHRPSLPQALASIQEEGGPPKKRRATVDNTNNDGEMASPASLVTFSNNPYSPFSQSGFTPSSPMTSLGGRRSVGSIPGGARGKKLSRQGTLPSPNSASEAIDQQGGDARSPNEDGEDKPARPGKRRRSYKEKKPNLTLEQKRLNHIDSEKRRRYMIKSAYDNLSIIVPGYKEAGVSKAGGIQLAVDFLKKMMGENEGLKERLERVREKAGVKGPDVEMTGVEGGNQKEQKGIEGQ